MSPRNREPAARAPRARNGNAPQRQRLIDACISALHLYGPSRTTVEKVVAIAKMSPGIVRFYFDSKAAMLVASLQFLAAEFEERVLTPVAELRATPVAALERMVELYLDPEIASPRKVSVWYAFWGEASSRQEYYDICGQKDANFAALVRELIEKMIEETGQRHLDAGGVALGLIGVLEVLWQDFAFQAEEDIDRRAARARAMAYLRSLFPGSFAPGTKAVSNGGRPARLGHWTYASAAAQRIERDGIFRRAGHVAGHERDLPVPGAYLTTETGAERVLLVRDADGRLHALRNCCPLAPHALALERRGRFEGAIECPVHHLAFAWDGSVRSHPSASAGSVEPLARLHLEQPQGLLIVRGARHEAEDEISSVLGSEPGDLKPVGPGASIEIEADWKIVVEQWLDDMQSAAPLSLGRITGWSAERYRHLLGRRGLLQSWSERFLAPNHWLEHRPDGCSIFKVVPLRAGCCRVERLDFSESDAPGDAERAARALQYLSTRLVPRLRRAARTLATSTQHGMIDYAYGDGARRDGPLIERFHRWLLARAPALALDRAPPDS